MTRPATVMGMPLFTATAPLSRCLWAFWEGQNASGRKADAFLFADGGQMGRREACEKARRGQDRRRGMAAAQQMRRAECPASEGTAAPTKTSPGGQPRDMPVVAGFP